MAPAAGLRPKFSARILPVWPGGGRAWRHYHSDIITLNGQIPAMAIDRDTVTRVAFLSRLEIEDAQKDAMTHDLSNILTFVEALNDVDASGVEPMTSVVEAYAPLREDQVNDGGYPDKVLANAPDRVQDFYAVPKVVE